MTAPEPPDELERLCALQQLRLLDTPPEAALDELASMAARIAETPVALISLVDAQRQWFKAKVGTDLEQTPRDQAFCAHAILRPDPMVVPDATSDPRFEDNPLVTRDANIRFYAGVPLHAPTGQPIGTLCVIDRVPRQLRTDQLQVLRTLARHVEDYLRVRGAGEELRARSADELPAALPALEPEYVPGHAYEHDPRRGPVPRPSPEPRPSPDPGPDRYTVTLRRRDDGSLHVVRDPHGLHTNLHPDDWSLVLCLIESAVQPSWELALRWTDTGRCARARVQWTMRGRMLELVVNVGEQASEPQDPQTRLGRSRTELVSELAHAQRQRDLVAASVAHDLKGPLTSMRMALDLLAEQRRDASSSDELQLVHMMQRSSESMLRLVLDLLDLGRHRAGALTLKPTPFALGPVIDELATQIRPALQRRGQTLIVSGGGPCRIDADPELVRRTVQNLLDNAHRHGPRDSTIELQVEPTDARVRLSVRDYGPGVPLERRQEVFEPYRQIDGHHARGHGLGLAFCRLAAEAHGGRIWVEDAEGGGARFVVELPLVAAACAA